MTDTKSAEALLPCPFCGAQANVHVAKDGCSVTCSNCMSGPDTAYRRAGELDEAAAAWNTRAAQPKPLSVAPDDEALNVHRFSINGRPLDVDGEYEFVKAPEVRRRIAELRSDNAQLQYALEQSEMRYSEKESALAACRAATITECDNLLDAFCEHHHADRSDEWHCGVEAAAREIRALKDKEKK